MPLGLARLRYVCALPRPTTSGRRLGGHEKQFDNTSLAKLGEKVTDDRFRLVA